MTSINLDDFFLEKINLKDKEHLLLIKKFEFDNDVRKYNYPHSGSFYNLVTSNGFTSDIFNSFFIIKYEDRIIGYLEIEKSKDVYLNYALLKEERGKGLGPKLLKELSDYLLNEYKDELTKIDIIVDNKNKPSIKATIKSGFEKIEDSNGFTTYRKSKIK